MTTVNGHHNEAAHASTSEFARIATQKATQAQTEAAHLLNDTATQLRHDARANQMSGESLIAVDLLAQNLERSAQQLRLRRLETPQPLTAPSAQSIATTGATWWLVGLGFAAGFIMGMFMASGNKQGK